MLDTVRRWWFGADTWRDAAARSEYQARVGRYLASRACQPYADELAEDEFAGLNQFARRALAELLDAVVLVDPPDYQRRPGESTGALRVLPFGVQSQELVTFLVCPPDDSALGVPKRGTESRVRFGRCGSAVVAVCLRTAT